MKPIVENKVAKARVLSYNFNILPRGCPGYQYERIETFLNLVDSYDVLLLQEVYATSMLPYAFQKRFCFKKVLLDGLKKKGFHHYVISRQPSYFTMLRHDVLSDNGLIIVSRFPICRRGSYTFRKEEDASHVMLKGCIFAEIEIPMDNSNDSGRIVFFNVHLRPEERAPSESSQVQQMIRFMDSVLKQLENNIESPLEVKCPFIVSGSFNIHGIKSNTNHPSGAFNDLTNELHALGNIKDIIFEENGFNPPTRPPKLFFPTRHKLEANPSIPQREDYFFILHPIEASNSRLEKFIVSSRRPYTYLSDHFGITSVISVPVRRDQPTRPLSDSLLRISPLVEQVHHEASNPTSTYHLDLLVIFCVTWMTLTVSIKPVVLTCLIWLIVRFSRYTLSGLPDETHFTFVTDKVIQGEAAMDLSPRVPDPLPHVNSLGDMWRRSVVRYRRQRCLGSTGYVGEVSWISYAGVDVRARELGAGLLNLGLKFGDTIGVQCDACLNASILDIACIIYGFNTLGLAGKRSHIRSLLDQHPIQVVFAGRDAVAALLTCRSVSLEKIIHFHPFVDGDDLAAAKNLNVSLISFESVELNGRLNPQQSLKKPTPDTIFNYSLDNGTNSEADVVFPMSQKQVLQDIKNMLQISVIPRNHQQHCMLWFSSYASLFNRVCILGLLSQGHAIAATDSVRLQEAFLIFKPSLLVASPSMFNASTLQLSCAGQSRIGLYNWMLDCAYQLRSRLIYINRRDSSLLRFLFFRSFERQLGGNVRRIILNIAEECSSFPLIEHISVCYSSNLREVSYINSVGLLLIDGIPAPGLRLKLEPMDQLAEKAQIAELTVTNECMEKRHLKIAACWQKSRTLTLFGSSSGILWPVDYQYTISEELERLYAFSRYVNDIFIFCKPMKPLVAVVYPNRDTIEYEWYQNQKTTQLKPFIWRDLVESALDIIQMDLNKIADEHHLHHSQRIEFIHFHPHAFRDHNRFLNAFGKNRRDCMADYFHSLLDRFYSEGNVHTMNNETVLSNSSLADTDSEHLNVISPSPKINGMRLKVPIALDIGGTFTKVAYIVPPGMPRDDSLSFMMHEASSLTDALGGRLFSFFEDENKAKSELEEYPRSYVGRIRFARIPSQKTHQFVEFIEANGVINNYKSVYTTNMRATGGGAYKYAQVVREALNVEFDTVKEMYAVVKGLNLVIEQALNSIFTVDVASGRHMPHQLAGSGNSFSPYPYLLINIGSGISFIKCLGPDGSHERVGGSPIGGATFWGLTRILTNLTSWEEVLEIMRLDGPGDNKNVDLLVGDIYGYNVKDLPAMLSCESVASSFGKFGAESLYKAACASPVDYFADDNTGEILSPTFNTTNSLFYAHNSDRAPSAASSLDIVRSLLNMISGNVTQLAYLHAKIHGIKNIFFAGGFVRNNHLVCSIISATLLYWSSGESKAHFLEHDGYLGVLGCSSCEKSSE
ncbi:unnamed protein product [Phytomonas sp. Hart1]|nr:unnamed protein product [Phytomonas sp. Hart1]|eukprot:CCW68782.1 unnamed protein product [Phytomonas sp. isolate Hart1]